MLARARRERGNKSTFMGGLLGIVSIAMSMFVYHVVVSQWFNQVGLVFFFCFFSSNYLFCLG